MFKLVNNLFITPFKALKYGVIGLLFMVRLYINIMLILIELIGNIVHWIISRLAYSR